MQFDHLNKYLDRLIQALKEENDANRIMLDNFYKYLETCLLYTSDAADEL